MPNVSVILPGVLILLGIAFADGYISTILVIPDSFKWGDDLGLALARTSLLDVCNLLALLFNIG